MPFGRGSRVNEGGKERLMRGVRFYTCASLNPHLGFPGHRRRFRCSLCRLLRIPTTVNLDTISATPA